MFIKAVKTWVANYWLTIIYATISFVVLDQILAYRLSSLLPGSSLKELSTINADFHFGALLQNPFFLIYKLPLTALSLLHNLTIYHTRLISTALALLTVLFVYYVLRRWQGLRTAILGCLLLASSSWFLVYARMATADIVYPFLISLTLAYGTRARRTKHTGRILFLGTILSLTCIYTPGLVWLVLLAAIWQHKLLSRQIFEAPTAAVVSMAVAIGFLLPLAYAIFRQPDLVNDFLGLRSSLIHLAGNSVGNIIDGFKVLAINGQTDASLGLVGLPVVDLFTGAMALLGTISLVKDHKLDRSRMMLATTLVSVGLIAFGGLDKLVILIPTIYILASLGIAHMINSWLDVFPRNPLARNVGVGIICTVVAFTSFYHLNRYFVAWPNTPETIHALHVARLK